MTRSGMKFSILAGAALFAAFPVQAQDELTGEVVVTGSRTDADYFDEDQTVIGLRRSADSAIQPVRIVSDSRDEEVRKREIRAMLESALQHASQSGVELVVGELALTAVTQGNYRDLVFTNAGRPDTSQVTFYVKSKMTGSAGDAQQRIDSFLKAVPATGRSLLEKTGALSLTIVNPDQYRDGIVRLIAAESKKYAGYFGSDYGVEISGLDNQLLWTQVSLSDVFLFIPYRFTIRPK